MCMRARIYIHIYKYTLIQIFFLYIYICNVIYYILNNKILKCFLYNFCEYFALMQHVLTDYEILFLVSIIPYCIRNVSILTRHQFICNYFL